MDNHMEWRGMVTKSRKNRLSFGHLALVDWLMEAPATRFALENTWYRASKDLTLREVVDGKVVTFASSSTPTNPELVDRLGGSLEIDPSALINVNAVHSNHSLAKPAADREKNGFVLFMESIGQTEKTDLDYGYRLLRITDSNREWWNTVGKAEFEAMKKERDEARKAVGRTIVIGATCNIGPRIDPETEKLFPAGFKHPLPTLTLVRPTYSATVVRETETRLYVQDVVRLRKSEGRESETVRGSAPNQYVDRSNVIADGISDAGPKAILAVDAERVSSFHEACDEALSVALGPLLNLHSRLFQAESMHDDLMREAISSDLKSKT